jgi:hypothetical protein
MLAVLRIMLGTAHARDRFALQWLAAGQTVSVDVLRRSVWQKGTES